MRSVPGQSQGLDFVVGPASGFNNNQDLMRSSGGHNYKSGPGFWRIVGHGGPREPWDNRSSFSISSTIKKSLAWARASKDDTKPYKFIGFGGIYVTKPYTFTGFAA